MIRWIILAGAYVLFLCLMLVFGIAMNRRHPLWARRRSEWFNQASRSKKALVMAAVYAALYLLMGAFLWLGATLGIPELRNYRNPVVLALTISVPPLTAYFAYLLFVRGPDDELRDWLEDLKESGEG